MNLLKALIAGKLAGGKAESRNMKQVGRALLIRGEYPIAQDAKSVDIPLPAFPQGHTWEISSCRAMLKNQEQYLHGEDRRMDILIGISGSYQDGNGCFSGFGKSVEKQTPLIVVVSANEGDAGYYNAGTSIVLNGETHTLTLGYSNSSRTFYWPEGGVLEWYLMLGYPQSEE